VNFRPGAGSRTQLIVAVETHSGVTEPLTTIMPEASPTILSLDAQSQTVGVISFPDTTDLAMMRNFKVPGHPAQSGDRS
jgi:hypothetical protein